MTPAALVPTERAEQVTVVVWARWESCRTPALRWLYAVPNGGHRVRAVAARLQEEGVRPGVPDLVLPVARHGYHGLYIEMKRRKRGTVSKEQTKWLNALRSEGYRAEVCAGADEAIAVLADYLGCRPQRRGAAWEP